MKSVAIALTPQAREKIVADPRFNESALLAAVNGELRARKLLDDRESRAYRTVEILIDDFATRSTSNAVLFGYIVGEGTLAADIKVRDSDRNELRGFRINASSRIATPAGAEDANPLEPLYRRFAKLTVDSLAGVRSKPDSLSDDAIPR